MKPQNSEIQEWRAKRRELRQTMKARGIRRTSFMNGGLTPEEYRCNADMFAIETTLKRLTANG